MKRIVVSLISIAVVVGLAFFGYKELKQYHHINTLKKREPKAIVVKNIKVNVIKHYLETGSNDVPVFESLDGKLVNIATLSKGQQINATQDFGKNWYEVRVGDNVGFIPKKDVLLTANNPQHLEDDLTKNPVIKYYITLKNTQVFGHRMDPLVRMALLPKAMRYPMSEVDRNWLTIDIGGKIGYVKRSGVKLDYGIPVLTYHHFLEKQEESKAFQKAGTTLSPETFDQQMGYLSKQHFTTIRTGDLESYLNGKIILPKNTVLITFDDGLKSVYRYGYPILKRYNLKATEFMITGRINKVPVPWNPAKEEALSYPEMAQMKDVFEFESHTDNLHTLIDKKSAVVVKPYNVVKADIALSQQITDAHAFAYPFGQYNMQAIQILKQLGFKSAYTIKEGYAKVGDNPYLIPRISVTPEIPFRLFKFLVNV